MVCRLLTLAVDAARSASEEDRKAICRMLVDAAAKVAHPETPPAIGAET